MRRGEREEWGQKQIEEEGEKKEKTAGSTECFRFLFPASGFRQDCFSSDPGVFKRKKIRDILTSVHLRAVND